MLFALALSSPLLCNPRPLITNDLDPGMAGQLLPTAPNLNDDCLIHIFDEMSLADLQAWGSTTRANYQKVSFLPPFLPLRASDGPRHDGHRVSSTCEIIS